MSRWKVCVLVVGGLAVVAGVVWTPFANANLIKFPSHLDVTTHYQGTYSLFVNPSTGAQMATPLRVPVTIDAHVQSEPGGGAHTVVLRETATTTVAGAKQTQQNQYVMDRRTMRNVKSPLSWAGTPANVVDRSGSYSITFPIGTSTSRSYPSWDDQTGTSYPVTAGASTKVDGLSTRAFGGSQTPTVVTPAEAASLQAQGFPATLSPAAFAAGLRAQGIDLAAIAKVLSPIELQTVATALSKPVPLKYEWSESQSSDVELRTGAMVALPARTEQLSVQPDLSGLTALAPVLLAHAADPSVAPVLAKLAAFGATPAQPVFQLSYSSVPASTASVVSLVKSKVGELRLAKEYIPGGLLVLGLLLIVVGLVPRRRPPQPAAEQRVEVEELRRAA